MAWDFLVSGAILSKRRRCRMAQAVEAVIVESKAIEMGAECLAEVIGLDRLAMLVSDEQQAGELRLFDVLAQRFGGRNPERGDAALAALAALCVGAHLTDEKAFSTISRAGITAALRS